MSVRARIQREVASLFENYDLILCPTCPTASFKLGSKVDDPLEMYLSDLFTTFVNLARIPSISVPAGFTSKENKNASCMPVGIQFAGKMFDELKFCRLRRPGKKTIKAAEFLFRNRLETKSRILR